MRILTDTARARLKRGVVMLASAVAAGTLLATVSVVSPFTEAPAAEALSGSEFNAGLIISDDVMYAKNTMNVAQIQSFLDAKGGTCVAGHTCLADYTMKTESIAATSRCAAYTGQSRESAAQIIWTVAQLCNVNPQALIVTLQKEQRLVTSTTPTSLTYRKATGYGCPDTADCDARYYGLQRQLLWTGFGYQSPNNPNDRYAVGKPGPIAYTTANKPNCGTKTVTVQNKATRALYVYTPYTPNTAALNNLTGLGDACSSYGNRNFWVFFNNWFGSSVIPQGTKSFVTAMYVEVLGRTPSDAEVFKQSLALLKTKDRTAFAYSFLSSNEYRTAFVKDTYRSVLGREAEAQGVKNWVAKMANGKTNQDDLPATFIATDEFYMMKGGSTDYGYVTALYQYILGRMPEQNGLVNWTGKVASQGRVKVVQGIWRSAESSRIRTNAAYVEYPGRSAGASEQVSWATKIGKAGYYKSLAGILGSAEYYNRAGYNYPMSQ